MQRMNCGLALDDMNMILQTHTFIVYTYIYFNSCMCIVY